MCNIRNPKTYVPSALTEGEMIELKNLSFGYVTVEQYNELLRKYDARGRQLARFKAKILRLYRVIDRWRNRPGI